jgi:transposase
VNYRAWVRGQTRTGCQRRYLPKDLLPYGAVHHYFALRRNDGTDKQIHDMPRMRSREQAGRTDDRRMAHHGVQPPGVSH